MAHVRPYLALFVVLALGACGAPTPPNVTPDGSPTASFDIVPVADARFDGTVSYDFDASASTDDGSIEALFWDFGGFQREVSWTRVVPRGYGRNGTYDIELTVVDDEGNESSVSKQLVIDDLPYDYWGTPPERISIGANGEIPNDDIDYGFALSADGRYAAFSTAATNLDPADVNAHEDVFLKDMTTGALELVSSGAADQETGSDAAMSADGRYVAYDVCAVSGTFRSNCRIEIKDRQTGTVEVVLPEGGLNRASLVELSGDGRVILFASSSLNGPRQLDVKDLGTSAVTRIGLEIGGGTYDVTVLGVGLSGDGNSVVFTAVGGNLVAGDTNGKRDVFVHRRDTGATLRASVAADGVEGDFDGYTLGQVITPDGRYVVFWSEASTFARAAENDGGSFGQVDDVYVKDLDTGALTLVSTNAKGVLADGPAILPTISADGRYVAFGAYASNLTPEMDRYDGECALWLCTQGFSYVKDLVTGHVAVVNVGLNDTASDEGDEIEPVISADGRYVGFFSGSSNLVTGDAEGTTDYFRALNPLWVP